MTLTTGETEQVVFRFKRGRTARWTELNLVLEPGEPGFETDGFRKFKIGDGNTPWNDLPYAGGGLSAYEVAVSQGYQGTEEQWLIDLVLDPESAIVSQVTQSVLDSLEPANSFVEIFNNALEG